MGLRNWFECKILGHMWLNFTTTSDKFYADRTATYPMEPAGLELFIGFGGEYPVIKARYCMRCTEPKDRDEIFNWLVEYGFTTSVLHQPPRRGH